LASSSRGEAGSRHKSPLPRFSAISQAHYKMFVIVRCQFRLTVKPSAEFAVCDFVVSLFHGTRFTFHWAQCMIPSMASHTPVLSMQGHIRLRSGVTTSRKLGRYQIRSSYTIYDHINPRLMVVHVLKCRMISSTCFLDTYASRAKSKYVLRPYSAAFLFNLVFKPSSISAASYRPSTKSPALAPK
jgi:hypothetical protein